MARSAFLVTKTMLISRHIYRLLPFLLALMANAISQDMLGCGGFIKSDVEINFSKIEVRLYTKQGTMKYSTDCAPNNGYYLIPVYDKGKFSLRVEPPKGWSFEPSSVDLDIDGKTDPCSKGEDINFQFKGFGVTGKVVSLGNTDGPSGVAVSLVKGTAVIQQVVSEQGGVYKFPSVLPGEYTLKASHAVWKFQQPEAKVIISKENADAGSTLTVHGYDVSGKVFSEGEPITGVNFVLFSSNSNVDVKGCSKVRVSGVKGSKGQKEICHVLSTKDGSFVFSSVPKGKYTLVPFYRGEHITFDVTPEVIDFTVEHASVDIKKTFQVTGFSVSGRVLESVKGKGVPSASIILNGEEQTKTNTRGEYHLDSMKTGAYVISVTAKDVYFPDTNVKITPNTPKLPDIIANSFSVCGKITIDQVPDGLDLRSSIAVSYHPVGKEADTRIIETDKNKKFCCKAAPGTYIFKVVVTDYEKKYGFKLIPATRTVNVKDGPVNDVLFSQFRATVTGTVMCLEKCNDINFSLSPLERPGNSKIAEISDLRLRGATLTFSDVLPGKYSAALSNDRWCWREKSKEFVVNDQDVKAVDFLQTGYVLSVSSTHALKLRFENLLEAKAHYKGEFNVVQGLNSFCVAEPGRYKMSPVSCHQFEAEVYEFDTAKPTMLTLTALRHFIEGEISIEEKADISVVIRSSMTDEEQTVHPVQQTVKKNQTKGPYKYTFSYWARSNEELTIEPRSKVLLFYPPSVQVTVAGDTCPGMVASFQGKKGLFVRGAVTPAIEDVSMVITATNDPDTRVHTQTDVNGKYSVGPLHSDREYTIHASKPGYILTELEDKKGHFKAFKLGKIAVQVKDVQGSPLENVLLSLSGGVQYRSNNLTHSNGTRVFASLSPGQYFLRPMMKEYRFEPSSQMIEVKEGTRVDLEIKGSRVAFSCLGMVTSLSGEAEPGVIVEAMGQDTCSQYQEEGKTDADGAFRIRGLQPKCQYNIQMKNDPLNEHIDRVAPKTKIVEVDNNDLENVNIIAFRQLNQVDITGSVVTATEHLSSLKVELYRVENLDSPVNTVTMENSLIFFLPSVEIDKKATYVIRLISTLSRSSYEYDTPEETFTADSHHKHFTFYFNPKRKSIDQELNRGSFLILPVTILLGAAGYHYQLILPFLVHILSYIQSLVTKQTAGITSDNVTEEYDDTDYEITSKKKKARRA